MEKQTKYNMVKEKVMEWITTGQVLPGDKIYPESELVRMFRVSRHTVRLAIGDLVHEGWLFREKGVGTFCTHQTMNNHTEFNNPTTKSIGVITTYISDYFFPLIIRGIESYLSDRGYSLILACTYNNIDKEKQCLESMLNRNIDGLIVEPTKSSNYNPNINYYLEFENKNIPYLMINQYYPQLFPPHFIVNDEKGGFIATDHLIELGHERIIGIFNTDDLQGVYRMKGFIRALRNNNITFSTEMILTISTEDETNILKDKIRKFILSLKTVPTGIVCYNDQLAITVLNILRDSKIRVPEDISIVGYDDTNLAVATDVKLTSVSHPKMNMGIEVAKWIVAAVENKLKSRNTPESIIYEPELIIRNSTKSLK
ncbi:substrate-binding domain-containing protein [Robertmurraya sp. P23]|uniref:substrate-binding domain-containing protein n=1 Tax=Robertmurraya sp. P23 TaxID=3436931 RepID=UPI003D960EC2